MNWASSENPAAARIFEAPVRPHQTPDRKAIRLVSVIPGSLSWLSAQFPQRKRHRSLIDGLRTPAYTLQTMRILKWFYPATVIFCLAAAGTQVAGGTAGTKAIFPVYLSTGIESPSHDSWSSRLLILNPNSGPVERAFRSIPFYCSASQNPKNNRLQRSRC